VIRRGRPNNIEIVKKLVCMEK